MAALQDRDRRAQQQARLTILPDRIALRLLCGWGGGSARGGVGILASGGRCGSLWRLGRRGLGLGQRRGGPRLGRGRALRLLRLLAQPGA